MNVSLEKLTETEDSSPQKREEEERQITEEKKEEREWREGETEEREGSAEQREERRKREESPEKPSSPPPKPPHTYYAVHRYSSGADPKTSDAPAAVPEESTRERHRGNVLRRLFRK